MKNRTLNSLPFVGIIAVVTLGIYFGKQPKPTYRDCVEFSSSPANTLQVYDQPDRASKSINYQPHQEKNNSGSLNEQLMNNGYNSTMP